ncbi:D-alanyl-D-alanine carboxypeptidase [Desulfobulbus rhabdoformis]|uniref:D-alanyl-D-alanine carboxypeptidase/D-alanyl-D-alanine-endopeptidase n=1 Tax=Desulfobulbus rhabdoformis TaxID=34032 RepID=UPI001962CEB5|nr:D-alanyl-D-alanine carboxypeptidase [Desulfobulbus rhabdoformis]MBM9612739.1 D-alanyl-D-alanine carboxypeptidase [Desulfobulbus rhabdoformis]
MRPLRLGLLVLVALMSLFDRQVGCATCRSFSGLHPSSAYGVADAGGQIRAGCNLDRTLVPASVLKIATVSVAIDLLGPDYRFATELYLDDKNNLFIKGFGDPSLVSEEIALLAIKLYQRGLRSIGTIYIDDSAFALEHAPPGQGKSDNPYDAHVGAVAVNFNTLHFSKKGNRVVSAEEQTPTLPLMRMTAPGYVSGTYRVNICAQGGDPQEKMARYAAELFAASLRKVGIAVTGYGGRKQVNGSEPLFYRHLSRKTLSELCRSTLRYSSNFMANLIFLQAGAASHGYPATWAKARFAAEQVLQRQLGEFATGIVLVDGAGLSRENRASARAMLQLLHTFQAHKDLLKKERGVALKTGTMSGVYNLAGYLPGNKAFVILLNQKVNTRYQVLAQLKTQVQ